jgi:hypothetical protein
MDFCVEMETMEIGYMGGAEARMKENNNNKWRNLKKKNGRGRNDNRMKEEKEFKICWEFTVTIG